MIVSDGLAGNSHNNGFMSFLKQILANFGFLTALVCGRIMQKVFFGPLLPAEVEVSSRFSSLSLVLIRGNCFSAYTIASGSLSQSRC